MMGNLEECIAKQWVWAIAQKTKKGREEREKRKNSVKTLT